MNQFSDAMVNAKRIVEEPARNEARLAIARELARRGRKESAQQIGDVLLDSIESAEDNLLSADSSSTNNMPNAAEQASRESLRQGLCELYASLDDLPRLQRVYGTSGTAYHRAMRLLAGLKGSASR